VKRTGPDWASWSTRRVIAVGLLYGLAMGCVVGVTLAVLHHHSLGDAVELVAFDAAVWCVAATGLLLLTRWLARHPRRR
jgi:hypothetical protein